jgi:hypothetical protein
VAYFDETIEIAKSKFVRVLDDTFGASEIDQFEIVADQIDEMVLAHLHDLIFGHIGRIIKHAKNGSKREWFILDRTRWKVLISKGSFSKGVYDGSVVQIAFIPHDTRSQHKHIFSEIAGAITEPGRFTKIELTFPVSLMRADTEYLFKLVDAIFLIAHRWLRVKLRRLLEQLIGQSTRELYDYIHITLPNKELAKGLMIGVFLKDRDTGRYVDVSMPEASTTDYFVDLAQERAHLVNKSPVSLALEAVGEVIDQDESPILAAFQRGHPVSINPAKTKYYSQSTEFRDTLFAVWPGGFTIYPLKNEGDIFLTALFPSENGPFLGRFFGMHAVRIADLALKRVSVMDRVIRKFRSIGSGVATEKSGIVELLGRFVGGILHAYSH